MVGPGAIELHSSSGYSRRVRPCRSCNCHSTHAGPGATSLQAPSRELRRVRPPDPRPPPDCCRARPYDCRQPLNCCRAGAEPPMSPEEPLPRTRPCDPRFPLTVRRALPLQSRSPRPPCRAWRHVTPVAHTEPAPGHSPEARIRPGQMTAVIRGCPAGSDLAILPQPLIVTPPDPAKEGKIPSDLLPGPGHRSPVFHPTFARATVVKSPKTVPPGPKYDRPPKSRSPGPDSLDNQPNLARAIVTMLPITVLPGFRVPSFMEVF